MHLLDILAYTLSIVYSVVLWLYLLWELCKEHGARGKASVVPSRALAAWAEQRQAKE